VLIVEEEMMEENDPKLMNYGSLFSFLDVKRFIDDFI
jgi:hypothetical protein